MSKIYVVQSRNFEYNDETYETTGGGNALHAYTSQAEAQKIATYRKRGGNWQATARVVCCK